MRLIAYSQIAPSQVLSNLGEVEYSYGLVLREFTPVLESLGELTIVADPSGADAGGGGGPFLSFSPPHLTRVANGRPTIPVFAWEFDTIPTDAWYDDPRNDWRTTLAQCGAAIVHSELTVRAVKRAMGEDFRVVALPAPVWDRMQTPERRGGPRRISAPEAVIMDTRDPRIAEVWPDTDLIAQILTARDVEHKTGRAPGEQAPAGALKTVRRHVAAWREAAFGDLRRRRPPPSMQNHHANKAPRSALWKLRPRAAVLDGVVFTSVFNPYDGRKNWSDILTAFCAALAPFEDATLVFKLSHTSYVEPLCDMLLALARMPKFRCRVVLLHGVLDQTNYSDLVAATHFIVNASHGEGQSLPLMEFMSAGTPAIAPVHSGMADYIDEDVALTIKSWEDATAWPHDPRIAYRTLRHQLDWGSLADAFRQAYSLVKDDPEGYAAMGRRAEERMRGHCSREVVGRRMKAFLETLG